MTNGKTEGVAGDVFRPGPEQNPRSREETYKRLHYYAARLALAVSDHLQDALINLRRKAYGLTDPELKKLALKGYSDEEYVTAVKEILCIWLHLEAVEQGGEEMPRWLLSFLRLTFGATDYIINEPKALDVVHSYEPSDDLNTLCQQTSLRACRALGFGDAANQFVPAILPVLMQTTSVRHQILERALVTPLERIEAQVA